MKTIVIAGGLLASAALLTGCGLKSIGGPTNQDTVTYQVTEKVAALHLRSGAGDIAVTEYNGSSVRVVETLQWRNDKPKTWHKVDGDTLSMSYDCEASWGSCGVDYKVEVPKGVQVKVDTGSGDITLRSLTGPVEVETGSGDVDGSGLGGTKILAKSGSGGVELKCVAVPDSAELRSGSGDVVLHVPQGTYDVDARAGAGDETVSVKTDSASPHKLTLNAGSGDVSVLPG
ncbi:DUF4097 family beta strand repeat-containing protein [Nonomuraea sp. NPDC005983]|uniref:DUF4097 family beta strand repeat-containing protein n=1 Tax=Nonomuraea sp. NPDC005983 TaxID=3155595 RepID=UPI00339EA292